MLLSIFPLALAVLLGQFSLVHAVPATLSERVQLIKKSSGCLSGYKADVNGICHRITTFNCDPSNCNAPIPAHSRPICTVDGECGFECNAGKGFNGTVCRKGDKPCDPAGCDSHTPSHAKATCFNDRCYFQCFPGYHRVADFCKRTLYACSTNAGACPARRPDHSTTFCINHICAVTCNNGYQYSENHNHCILNPTKCGTSKCQPIANGEVKCDGNTCIYSCNAAAGFVQTGNTTCTLAAKSSIGGVFACWNHPIEVIRVEMQSSAKAITGERPANLTMISTLKYIYKENGLRGLFRGVTPRIGLSVYRTICLVTLADYVKAVVAAQ